MQGFKSSLERKAAMYEMLMALENDFISNIYEKLCIEDLPAVIIESSNKSGVVDMFLSILQGIDLQEYIEICNKNLVKLHMGRNEKDFLNKEFVKIIPIRNNVMHPRPLGIFDYVIVETIFNGIEEQIPIFEWKCVKDIKKKIENHPEELRLPPACLRKSETIIENIPVSVDFEDTSFIGRKREIGELKEKLNKRHVHILSIIGDGGIGKTAIAIKLLYDMLDDPNCKFELILWTSLKTNELNNYEFKEIDNAITTTSGMYEKLAEFVGRNDIDDTREYIIKLAKEFNMLLVLDNLETINTDDIKEFLDEFIEYGKVIVTSRIGLGEMEHRYKLNGLDDNDVIDYMNALLELYGFESIMSDKRKKDIAINQLYSNPLAIKWFVRCLYNGDDVDTILKNKSELAMFCMSNVYEKLSPRAHEVLDVLLTANRDMTFAELMYYLDYGVGEYKDISYAINDLVKCNFVDDELFRLHEKVSITNFAKEFLRLSFIENKELLDAYRKKEGLLRAFVQKQLQNKESKPYALKTFCITESEPDRVVAAYLLDQAIRLFEEKKINEAMDKVDLAKKITPNFYQCNKIAAYIYGSTSIEKAKEEYRIAIQCCEEPKDITMAHISYAGYLLRCNDYNGSLEQLELAKKFSETDDVHIAFEKAKVCACIGKYNEAYETLNEVNTNELTAKQKNVYYTRKADIKRREAENYDFRDIDKKVILVREAFDILEECEEPDPGIRNYMNVLAKMLSFIHYYDPAMILLRDELRKHYYDMRKDSFYKDFVENMSKNLEYVRNESVRKEISRYIIDFNSKFTQLKENEGIVTMVNYEKKYAFFRNSENRQGVYFRLTPKLIKVKLGSIVIFGRVIDEKRGKMAIDVEIIEI